MDSSLEKKLSNARFIRAQMPAEGLFEGHAWRIAPNPLELPAALVEQFRFLGRILLQFNRAVNLLYRLSVSGKQPTWISQLLDQGKPAELIALQRHAAFKNDVPRVIRPDILLTDSGFSITELDSVPGGIGLTGWLNRTYHDRPNADAGNNLEIVGGRLGMQEGFGGIFGDAPRVHLVISEESATYRPEMRWLAAQLGDRFQVRNAEFQAFADGDAVYRFFELFDAPNVANAHTIFERAAERRLRLTPPPKTIFEEKLILALLWNRNLRGYWRQELGEAFLNQLQRHVPYSWVLDPTPLPPHAAIPGLNLTDWNQLKTLSQKERDLILKISGFSPTAWGARGVFLGSDLSTADWSAAVDSALGAFANSPHVLQQFHKPRLVETEWLDESAGSFRRMQGRVRLCPYYFVHGEGDQARAQLSGILATVCPADKKIIHGMTEAVLTPVSTLASDPAPVEWR